MLNIHLLTKFVFTRKTAPPTGGHANILTNFELDRDIIGTNVLTVFHEDLTNMWPLECLRTNVDGRTDGQTTDKDDELGRDFIGTKLLTKFNEDGTRNVASRVFTSKC
ncbi:hypothetical protein DPMN_084490 [Dreissena polymorpha]|uniref:Uncharacterized protein n=1 Tax=Dreissena polymorpha TaxID=45954 RepID=A0A9D3YEE7_DREPO|nr:hypothetical protein DPMN_084490 [Dreissena polymorpha]